MKRWLILSILAVALICCGCSPGETQDNPSCALSLYDEGTMVYTDYVVGVKLSIPVCKSPAGLLYSMAGWDRNEPVKFFFIYLEEAHTDTLNQIVLRMSDISSYPWGIKAGDELMDFTTAAGQAGTIIIRKMPAVEENTISHTYEDENGELKVWYESARGEHYLIIAGYSQCMHNISTKIDCDDYDDYFDFVYQIICSLELI